MKNFLLITFMIFIASNAYKTKEYNPVSMNDINSYEYCTLLNIKNMNSYICKKKIKNTTECYYKIYNEKTQTSCLVFDEKNKRAKPSNL